MRGQNLGHGNERPQRRIGHPRGGHIQPNNLQQVSICVFTSACDRVYIRVCISVRKEYLCFIFAPKNMRMPGIPAREWIYALRVYECMDIDV